MTRTDMNTGKKIWCLPTTWKNIKNTHNGSTLPATDKSVKMHLEAEKAVEKASRCTVFDSVLAGDNKFASVFTQCPSGAKYKWLYDFKRKSTYRVVKLHRNVHK